MSQLPLIDAAPQASTWGARPAGLGEAQLISLRTCVMLLLVLVFWKASGIRYWPHLYAGGQITSHRLVYYTEFLVGMMALAGVALYGRLLWRCARQQGWLAALFVAYAFLAGQRVPLPPVTAFLGVSGYLDVWVALTLAAAVLGPAATLRLLAQLSFAAVFLNLASAAVPSVSVMIGDFAGRFRGLTAHRNDLAQLAYVCAFIAVAARSLVPRWLVLGTVLGATALIAGARSVQGILLLPAGLFIYQFSARIRLLKHPVVVFSGLVLLCLVAFVWEQFGSMGGLLAHFGRDASFSGRDRIWALSLHLIQHMPFSGYGPGQIGSGVLSESLLQRFGLGTLFGSAHSSYLEAFLTYGWLGGALFVATLLLGLASVLRALLHRADTYTALACTLMLTALIGGVTASEKLFLPGLGWFTFVLALVLAQHRLPPRA